MKSLPSSVSGSRKSVAAKFLHEDVAKWIVAVMERLDDAESADES